MQQYVQSTKGGSEEAALEMEFTIKKGGHLKDGSIEWGYIRYIRPELCGIVRQLCKFNNMSVSSSGATVWTEHRWWRGSKSDSYKEWKENDGYKELCEHAQELQSRIGCK